MNALVLVDIQSDFLPGGALPVPHGDEVVPLANTLSSAFELVVATQDWHPANHASFASNHPGFRPGQTVEIDGLPQTLWPDHCVQNTPGVELAGALDASRVTRVFRKGTDPRIDSYSGFFDNGRRRATGMGDFLTANRVGRVYIMGLATDYCVKFTALDARCLGFETFVIEDACRGVELASGDVARAMAEMTADGVRVVRSAELMA